MSIESELAQYWMTGRVLEIGAGSSPTPGAHVTVDNTPPGEVGTDGCEAGRTCQADFQADMSDLPFDDKEFDTIVARHVLEHDADTITVLREWFRVADRLVIICPDQDRYPGNTIKLDPTHLAAFTEEQLRWIVWHTAALYRLAPNGLKIETQPAHPDWSFLLVAEIL